MAHEAHGIGTDATLRLLAEQLTVSKRRITEHVAVRSETRLRDVAIEEQLHADHVEIEHRYVGQFVDAMPVEREEDGVTILPIVEEVAVVVRRLFLREEIHIRKTRTSSAHIETVTLREQHAVVTRSTQETSTAPHAMNVPMPPSDTQSKSRSLDMDYEETIVAVYDTPAHAELAVNDLLQANIPESAISRHGGMAASDTVTTEPVREHGFWASLFGGETAADEHVYERSAQSGSSVVVVKTTEHEADAVISILESHAPINIDERAASYGIGSGVTADAGTEAFAAPIAEPVMAPAAVPAAVPTASGAGAGTISLSAESLVVGKRLVNRGGTRLRRYVVETPVEESVSLHSETIQVDRRPVMDGAAVANPDFSEKVVEMTATAEEAVIGKTAHVVEEVSLRKEATDREETIHETVRREEVEVEQMAGEVVTEKSTAPVLEPRAPVI